MNDVYTFPRLMVEYGIVIPQIQRDYAQGRVSAYDVRQSFLSSIIRTISSGAPLTLDFVYGPIINGAFLPLDGQQRLTTLFLVYWYFNAEVGEWKCFEYQARRIAQRFIEFLRTEGQEYLRTDYAVRELPSKWLQKQSGFVPAWERDPTVSGMLVLLDDLHLKSYGVKCENYTERLNGISFCLHICDAKIRADDTYLKINARGEHLSEWENIKSILDSRVKDLVGREDDVGDAAREWREKINGAWMSAIEGFLPDRGDSQLAHYIALSVALVNAAFRNIVDLAAMAAMTQIGKKVDDRRLQLGERFSKMKFSEAVVGVRDRASDIKDLIQLEKFFVREFHEHTTTYEDYRDKSIFTDEAFIVVAKLFNALTDERKNVVVGGWSDDRGMNVLWGDESMIDAVSSADNGKMSGRSFVKDFLFAGANPEGDSLLEREREPFRAWIGQDRIAQIFQRTDFTYESGLRYLLLASPGDSLTIRFGKTRGLNLLDNIPKIDAENFRKFTSATAALLGCFADEVNWTMISESLENNFKDLGPIIESEKRKIKLYVDHRKESLSSHTFGKIEKRLGLMSGCVEFTYDECLGDFDEGRAEFFLSEFLNQDNVVNDTGFLALVKCLPENVDGLLVPQSSARNKDGFGSWKKVLLNPIWIAAFARMYQAGNMKATDCHVPSWCESYIAFIKKEGNPYRRLCRHNAGHNGGSRLFAYNTPVKIAGYCACVEYSNFERKLIDLIRPDDRHCIRYGDTLVLIKDSSYGIPIENIYANTTGVLQVWEVDGCGSRIGRPQIEMEYKSQDELYKMVSEFIELHNELKA